MSAKPKPSQPAKPPARQWFAFQLPCGSYVGRANLLGDLEPQPPERSIPFNLHGIERRKVEFQERFPGAKVVPSPHPSFQN